MDEKILLKTALACSLVGLLLLYFVADIVKVEEETLDDITIADKDEFVKARGVVNQITDAEEVAIMELMQPNELKVVMFKEATDNLEIREGSEVEVIGKVDEYENELEVIADRVRVIR